MNAIFTLGGTEMKLIIGSSAELGKGIDTTGQQCNVSSSCKLYGLGLGAVADVTVQVGSGSLSSGWSLGLFGAGVAVRGWEVTVGAGSDGMFGSASQARGLFFGAGVRVCEQSVSACR